MTNKAGLKIARLLGTDRMPKMTQDIYWLRIYNVSLFEKERYDYNPHLSDVTDDIYEVIRRKVIIEKQYSAKTFQN